MAAIVFIRNPLNVRDRELHQVEPGTTAGDWLLANYPAGFGVPVRHFHNGGELEAYGADGELNPDYLELELKAGDVDVLALAPAGFVAPILISALITAAITSAVSLALTLFFKKPEAPAFAKQAESQVSPVYDVSSSQNSARLGEPVPVIYGRVLHTPDYAAQPYNFYTSFDQSQNLDLLLCLGIGEVTVNRVFIGDTDVSSLTPGQIMWQVIPPSVHRQQEGNIAFLPGYFTNVISSPEVGSQELKQAGDLMGPFVLSGNQQKGNYAAIDVEFPQGLYQRVNGPDAWWVPTGVVMQITFFEVDVYGQIIPGTEIAFDQPVVDHRYNPLRYTFYFNLPRVAAWAVQLYRYTPTEPNGGETNLFTWKAARLYIPASPNPVYGQTTLLAVRINATAVTNGQQLIKVDLTRKLPPLGIGAPVETQSPVDAFADIYTNADYGAARPAAELDGPRLAALKPYYGGYQFNAVFTNKTTVWEALSNALQGVAGAPLPLGALMSIAQDGIKPIRSMLWTEQNIKRDSFKLTYSFDNLAAPDCVQVEYRNPVNFNPAYVQYPTTGAFPDKVVLFGCTDYTHASQFARLSWQRRQLSRRLVEFDTELEGLIPYPGERVAINHQLAHWGLSGMVIFFDAAHNQVQLDKDLPWLDTPGPFVMAFRSELGGMSDIVSVRRGALDNVAVLEADPWNGADGWRTLATQEPTHFAWGQGATVVRDFILTEVTPRDPGTVAIQGVRYDPNVYANTLTFLAFPVP